MLHLSLQALIITTGIAILEFILKKLGGANCNTLLQAAPILVKFISIRHLPLLLQLLKVYLLLHLLPRYECFDFCSILGASA